MFNPNKFRHYLVPITMLVLALVAGSAYAATTIGTNVSTGGTLSVTGTSTLTGAVTAAAGLSVTTGGITVTAGGLTITAGGLNVNSTGVTNAGAVAGVTTLSMNNQLTSTLASGTAPLVVTSTTPVANLTTVPTTYNAAGTQQTNVHIVTGTATLDGGSPPSVSVSLSGSAVFTNGTSYQCTATAQVSPTEAVSVVNTDGTAFVIHSPNNTSTASVGYICIGN